MPVIMLPSGSVSYELSQNAHYGGGWLLMVTLVAVYGYARGARRLPLLTACGILAAMWYGNIIGMGEGTLLPPVKPKPRHGERAARIREMYVKYPTLSNSGIARTVGCTPSNVDSVLKTFLGRQTVEDLRSFQANKADIYDAIQVRTLASITQEHLDKASALQLVTAAAIMEDKKRLVSGEPTSFHVTALIDVLTELRKHKREE